MVVATGRTLDGLVVVAVADGLGVGLGRGLVVEVC